MKRSKRLICAVFAFLMMLPGISAFAADATAIVSIWDHDLYVEGNLAACLDASGKPLYPLSCGGSIYVPLRTAAEWMGKDLTKSADGKTFALSGTKEPVYHDRVTSSVKSANTAAITVLSGAQLRLDGNAVSLTDASGKAVNIISSNGEPYLPVRSVASMLGMSLKYVGAPDEIIYMRTPLTDEQLKACKEYLSALSNYRMEFLNLFGQGQSFNQNLAQLSTAMKSVEICRAHAQKFKDEKRPDCKLLNPLYKELDQVIAMTEKGCDLAEQLIQVNAPLEQVVYVLHEDYSGQSYKASAPTSRTVGVSRLCMDMGLAASQFSYIVEET